MLATVSQNTQKDDYLDDYRRKVDKINSFTPNPVTPEALQEARDAITLDVTYEQLGGLDPNKFSITRYANKIGEVIYTVNNMLYAQTVIMKMGAELSHVVIPKFCAFSKSKNTLVNVNKCPNEELDPDSKLIIVFEKLDYEKDTRVQKKMYLSPDVNNAIRELATFICETGYREVDYVNTPILRDGKIAILGSFCQSNPSFGLTVGNFIDGNGLSSMISLNACKMVVEIAMVYDVKPCRDTTHGGERSIVEHYLKRLMNSGPEGKLMELMNDDKVYESKSKKLSEAEIFYLNNKIFTGFEEITMEGIEYPEFRGFSIAPLLASKEYKKTPDEYRQRLKEHHNPRYNDAYIERHVKDYERDQKESLEKDKKAYKKYKDMEELLMKMTKHFVDAINAAIAENTGDMSISDRRNVCVRSDYFFMDRRDGLVKYLDLKLIKNMPPGVDTSVFEEDPPNYGEYVMEKLKQQGKIRHLRNTNSYRYYINA